MIEVKIYDKLSAAEDQWETLQQLNCYLILGTGDHIGTSI